MGILRGARAVAAGTIILVILAGCTLPSDPEPSPTRSAPSPTPTPSPTPPPVAGCPEGASVSTNEELAVAVASANPGDVIVLQPAVYDGPISVDRSGIAGQEITLCGSREAVIDGSRSSYAVHLLAASYWRLQNFSIKGGKKGLMLDGASFNTISGLSVSGTGDEAVHLRASSQNNLVENNVIGQTGQRQAKYGEGIYVGSAESNWCVVTSCQPDLSDNNRIIGNTISQTTAESIDVKEGTTGGEIRGNTFDATGMIDSDSYIDVKGTNWTVADNVGRNSPLDGAQVHLITEGPGSGNVFSGNRFAVGVGGYAIQVFGAARRAGNRVLCNNLATDGAAGANSGLVTNVGCVRS